MSHGERIKAHKHNNAHLSAIYYVCRPSSSVGGDIIFTSSSNYFPSINPAIQPKNYYKIGIRPFTSLLLIFPSYFTHEVTTYYGDMPRYSISFDFFIASSAKSGEIVQENIAPDPSTWSKFK